MTNMLIHTCIGWTCPVGCCLVFSKLRSATLEVPAIGLPCSGMPARDGPAVYRKQKETQCLNSGVYVFLFWLIGRPNR